MKNSRKREIILVASGIVLGVAITDPAAQEAEMLTAQRSTQKVCVDGQQVQMEAYSISGSNYVSLRDIDKAVDFSVNYDPLTNTVRINTSETYADEATAQSSHTVTLPTDGSKYTPQVGDHIFCDDGTDYAITDVRRWEMNISPLLDSFKENKEWLKKMLDGKAKERLLEFVSIHNDLDELVGYKSFRDGFILGVRLMMEIACGQGRFSEVDRNCYKNSKFA